MPRILHSGESAAARRGAQLRAVRRERLRQRSSGVKQSSLGAMSMLGLTPGGVDASKRDYKAFSREAYMRCVIAYRAVTVIARGVGMVPWYVRIDGDIVEDPNEPLTRLLRRPNPTQGTSAYFEEVTSFYLLAGNSYPLRVLSGETPSADQATARPLELWSLRPDRVTVNVDEATHRPVSYTYQVGDTKKVYKIDPVTMQSDVLHLLTFNPADDVYGLSPVEPASYGVDQHNAGNEWNYKLLKNSAKPSGAIVHEPGDSGMDLSDEQRDDLKRQLRERSEGELNAGRTLLLEGYLKWQQMGLTPMDMDFSNTMASAARQVATGYGVPPMLVGIPGDATFANYKEARLALWEDTITPYVAYLRDELNNWLAPSYGKDVYIDYDLDAVPALAERRVALWEKLSAASFLNINEKREGAGYDEIDGGDVLLVPAGMIPIETADDEDEDVIPDGVEDIDPEEAGKMAYGR